MKSKEIDKQIRKVEFESSSFSVRTVDSFLKLEIERNVQLRMVQGRCEADTREVASRGV